MKKIKLLDFAMKIDLYKIIFKIVWICSLFEGEWSHNHKNFICVLPVYFITIENLIYFITMILWVNCTVIEMHNF